MEELIEGGQESAGTVEVQFPFDGCSFGFALFNHQPDNTYELCMVDAASTQILLSIGKFNTIDEVQEEYRQFVDTFVMAMRKIEWGE